MKAAVVQASIYDFYFTPRRAAALGAVSLVRELEKIGWTVSFLNLPLMGKARSTVLPDELDYLRPFIVTGETGPMSWFTGYKRFGPPPEESAEKILAGEPDVIFISQFAWAYSEEVFRLAEELKNRRSDIPVVVGGHGPSCYPEYYFRTDRELFDLVVSGECEGQIKNIIETIGSESRYLDLRGRESEKSPELVIASSTNRGKRRYFSIILSRGCPRRCRFCSNHLCHGSSFRISSPDTWLSKITVVLKETSGSRIHLNFEDDNILFRKNEFFGLLGELKDQFPGISYSAENGLDYLLLDTSDLSFLKNIGFSSLNLSLAVFTKKKSDDYNRSGDADKLANLLKTAAEIGLPTTTHFISGLSGDDPEKAVQTLKFLDALPTRVGISNFYPVPGIPGFEEKQIFEGKSPGLALGSSVYPWSGSLTTAQMITAFRLARWSNFRKEFERLPSRFPEVERSLYLRIHETGCLHSIVKHKGKPKIIAIPNLDVTMQQALVPCPK